MSAAIRRLRAAWRELFREQRLAASAALGLIASMFLPWYQQTGFLVARQSAQKIDGSLSAFQSWGLVEASILLVALAVLALLFARSERRAFHLPLGDGIAVAAGGAWVMFLVFYRQVDKPSGSDNGSLHTTIGVNWGIFIAFLLGALLTYAGWRIHTRHRPEPRLDGDDPRTGAVEGDPTSVAPRRRPRPSAAAIPADERPTVARLREEQATAAIPPDERPTRVTPSPQRRQPVRGRDGQFEGQLSFDDQDDAPPPAD